MLEDVIWPDRALGPLNTAVPQFPLPGNVGVDDQATPCWLVAEEDIIQDKVSADDVMRKLIVSNQLSERQYCSMTEYVFSHKEKVTLLFFTPFLLPCRNGVLTPNGFSVCIIPALLS